MSGPTDMATSTLATVVSIIATMKAVYIVAQQTPDAHSAVIVLDRPAPYLLSALSSAETPIVPHRRYGDADPLALSAGELVRVAKPVFRPEPGPDEDLHDVFVEFLFFGDDAVIAHRLADDLADRHARVQASVGVLENNLDAPADARRILLQRLADILAVKEHGSGGRRLRLRHRVDRDVARDHLRDQRVVEDRRAADRRALQPAQQPARASGRDRDR